MKKYFALLFICFSIYSNANVKLPLLFNDGMVLQRDKPISVWGWADANEKIEVHFNKQIVKTKADKNGKWIVRLKVETLGDNIPEINNISILGYEEEVLFTMDNKGLHFKTPNQKIGDKAFVIKIETK